MLCWKSTYRPCLLGLPLQSSPLYESTPQKNACKGLAMHEKAERRAHKTCSMLIMLNNKTGRLVNGGRIRPYIVYRCLWNVVIDHKLNSRDI